MPLCPQCHQEVHKRRNEACPLCGQAISLHKGNFYRTEDGAPNLAIITEFEKLVGQQLSKAQGTTIPFRMNHKSAAFRSELVTAEQIFDQCDNDLDLARRTLNELFSNRLWSWKSRSSLRHLLTDMNAAVAIARVAQQAANADVARQLTLADQLSQKEDVFG